MSRRTVIDLRFYDLCKSMITLQRCYIKSRALSRGKNLQIIIIYIIKSRLLCVCLFVCLSGLYIKIGD